MRPPVPPRRLLLAHTPPCARPLVCVRKLGPDPAAPTFPVGSAAVPAMPPRLCATKERGRQATREHALHFKQQGPCVPARAAARHSGLSYLLRDPVQATSAVTARPRRRAAPAAAAAAAAAATAPATTAVRPATSRATARTRRRTPAAAAVAAAAGRCLHRADSTGSTASGSNCREGGRVRSDSKAAQGNACTYVKYVLRRFGLNSILLFCCSPLHSVCAFTHTGGPEVPVVFAALFVSLRNVFAVRTVVHQHSLGHGIGRICVYE